MTQTDILQSILEKSNYSLALFEEREISALRERVFTTATQGAKDVAYVRCIVRDRDIQLKPEEIVRQLFSARLLHQYGYPKNRLVVEHPVSFGVEQKRADIVILDKDRADSPYTIVEVKNPRLLEGKNQLRSYCNATGAPIGVWTNGQAISRYHRKEPNYFEDISDIPRVDQSLEDILGERFTLQDLILRDKVINEGKSLKDIILEMENEVLANAGVDVFEEVFKLIFTKLYDEFLSQGEKRVIEPLMQDMRTHYPNPHHQILQIRDALAKASYNSFRTLEFRNTGQTDSELKQKIQHLFDRSMDKWPGVFPEGTTFELSDSHLAICVSSLQDVKLLNSNLLVVDEAFEYLVNKSAKGEKGQFFTPRHVIDMCVQMLNPKRGEHIIDTAAGSCGFPVHTIFKFTEKLFTDEGISERDREDARKVYGIDFDEKTVRVARTLNLIAGDGETNVLHLNTLDFERWSDKTEKDRRWISTYNDGFARLEKLRAEPGQNRRFNFDIVMANPPFAGDIKEGRILHHYALALSNGKVRSKVGRDVLFIERNLDFLKPGGRMAIVLPQGRFNNVSDKYIREYIAERARILAVVGLHPNTFKPHTGTKTSVLFLQKWNDDPDQGPLCAKVNDYPIFMAVSEKGGKDNSGAYIYVKGLSGNNSQDKFGHLIVDHDLHSHDGELPHGIADAFIDWAHREGLSFWS